MEEISKKLSLKETFELTPIEKYKTYGKYPYKLFIHILLILATTVQTIVIIADIASYSRGEEKFIYNTFLNTNDKVDINYKRYYYLLNTNDLIKHVKESINKFFILKNLSIEEVEYLYNNPKVRMEAYYLDKDILNLNISEDFKFKLIYDLTQSDMGPFILSNENFKYFINQVKHFCLIHEFKTYIPYYLEDNFECFKWNVKQIYDYSERVHIKVYLEIVKTNCIDRSNSTFALEFLYKLVWIHLIVFILAFTSMILSFKSFWKIILMSRKLYNLIKTQKRSKKDKKVEKIDEEQRDPLLNNNGVKIGDENKEINDFEGIKKTHNYWIIIIIIGNISQIFGSGLCLVNTDYVFCVEAFVGIGCFFSYINLIKYISKYTEYSSFYFTLRISMPTVLKFLFSSSLIFCSFLMFAFTMFWRSERFATLNQSMYLLFCIIFGDCIFDTFNNLIGANYVFMGIVYFILYIIIFNAVIFNIFIAIIEDTYVSIKATNKNHWIYNHLNNDKKQQKVSEEKEPIEDLNEIRKGIEIDFTNKTKKVENSLYQIILISKNLRNLSSNNIKDFISLLFIKKLNKLEDLLTDIKLSVQKKD